MKIMSNKVTEVLSQREMKVSVGFRGNFRKLSNGITEVGSGRLKVKHHPEF